MRGDRSAEDGSGWLAAIEIRSPTGAWIHTRRLLPQGRPRAVVQINHGLAEHSGRYEGFARFLARGGFAVYAHDHRGHGRTRAPDAPQGTFAARNGADSLLADVAAMHDHIAAEHPGVPVIAFGHSLGGVIALNFVLRQPQRVVGAALWNTTIAAPVTARAARALLIWERFRLGSDTPSRLLSRLTFEAWAASIPKSRTRFDWLSHDAAEVDCYLTDPLCGWDATVGMWRDIFELMLSATNREKLALSRDLPLQLIGGGADPATSGGKAIHYLAQRLRKQGFSDVDVKIYPQARHETLHELGRDAAMQDFAEWAGRVAERATIATAAEAD